MTFQFRVVVFDDNGQEQIHDVTSLQRTELRMETLGLTLAEGQTILSAVQHVVVEARLPRTRSTAGGQPCIERSME